MDISVYIPADLTLRFLGSRKGNSPSDEAGMTVLDGLGLGVVGGHQRVFKGSDLLDSFLLKRTQTGIKGLLFGQESLDSGQVTAVVVRSDKALLLSYWGKVNINL